MTLRLFHSADLHLSTTERDYAFEVLQELVYHCRRLEAHAWLLSGDVFDSHEDLRALAADFHRDLAELSGVPVVMIPGNHELSGGKAMADLTPLEAAAGDGFRLATQVPYTLLHPAGLDLELLAVPFQRGYGDYAHWRPPAKERRWRVALLHGVVNGLTYTGASEEDEHAVIDPDLFARLGLDYAALGHIHTRGEARFGACVAHYPGSGRVWRRGETGARHATLVTLDDAGVRTEAVALQSAGAFHVRCGALDESGALIGHAGPDALLESLRATYGPADWVRVELGGLVEDLTAAEALQRALARGGEGHFRRLEVVLADVVAAERLRDHPLVRSFDALWRKRHAAALEAGDAREAALLERARRLALEQVHERLVSF